MDEKEKMVAAFKNFSRADQEDILNDCFDVIREKDLSTEVQEIKENCSYLNKYYKCTDTSFILPRTKYYKTISPFAKNTYHVSMLSFPEFPRMSLLTKITKSGIDSVNGRIDLDSFKIEDIFVKVSENTRYFLFNKFEEISKEEWEEAFDKHCKILKELEHKYKEERVFEKDD